MKKIAKFLVPALLAMTLAGCNQPQPEPSSSSSPAESSTGAASETSASSVASEESTASEESKESTESTSSIHEVVHVESVTYSPNTLTLKEGQQQKVLPTVLPDNADDKSLSFASSAQEIATVDADGTIHALKEGIATITATAADGGITGTLALTVDLPDPTLEVVSLNAPGFMAKYNAKVASMDEISTIQSGAEPSRNTYYKNANGSHDAYRVGTKNRFKFAMSASWFDEVTYDEGLIDHPYVNYKVYEIENETATELTSVQADALLAYANDEIQLKDAAAGKKLKIVFTLDSRRYIVGDEVDPIEFTFEAMDGYNVYDAKELSLFDTRGVRTDGESAIQWANPWKDIKEELGYENVLANALIIQNDITVTSADISSEFLWNLDDILAYKADSPTDFNDWFTTYNESRVAAGLPALTEDQATALLAGSMRDYVCIYSRKTQESDDFVIEGNYYTIDCSQLPQIHSFNDGIEDRDMKNWSHEDGSHGQLFAFNRFELEGSSDGSNGGVNTIRNITMIGNGDRANDPKYMGGLISYTAFETTVKFSNLISSKTFSTWMVSRIPTGATQNVHLAKIDIDRCKSFDSFNSMFYFFGTVDNVISNSYMKGAGGAIMLLDDINASDAAAANHGACGVDCYNCYFENYVSGAEFWFARQNASLLVQAMSAVGSSSGFLGINAAAAGSAGRTIAQMIESIPHVNLIAISIDGRNPLGNTETSGTNLSSYVRMHRGENDLGGLDLAAFNAQSLENAGNLTLQGIMASQGMAMIFNAPNGEAMAAANEYGTEALMFNPDLYATYKTQIDAGFDQAGQGALKNLGVIPLVQLSTLAQGACLAPGFATAEYVGGYVKAAAGTRYLGCLFGTSPIA